MSELFASPFFGIALSILAFWVGVRIQKKTGLVVCNPLLIGIVLVVGVLLLFRRKRLFQSCQQDIVQIQQTFLGQSCVVIGKSFRFRCFGSAFETGNFIQKAAG